jgi:hypothetical protein
MSKADDEHARQNELKRRKAADLLSAKLRRQQRSRTDEALLKTVVIDPEKTRRPPREGDK